MLRCMIPRWQDLSLELSLEEPHSALLTLDLKLRNTKGRSRDSMSTPERIPWSWGAQG